MFFASCTGTGRSASTDRCATVVPTCDDGRPALVYDDFDGMCQTTFTAEQPGDSSGDQWNVFEDEAGDPPTPIVAAIVNASAPPYTGTEPAASGVSVNGQFGSLAAPLGSTATWIRWTVLGVDADGPVTAVATSVDGVTWLPSTTSDTIGAVFTLDAGTTCSFPEGHPPPPTQPCPGLSVHLEEAIFVCPGPP
jgi:hypothetical protein